MCEMFIGLALLFLFSATGSTGLCTSATLSRGLGTVHCLVATTLYFRKKTSMQETLCTQNETQGNDARLNCSVVHYVHVYALYIPNAYFAQKCYRCFYWELTTGRVKVPQLLLFICIKQCNHILYEQCAGPNCDHEEYPLGTACGNLLMNFRSSLAPYQALALYPGISLQHLPLAVLMCGTPGITHHMQ